MICIDVRSTFFLLVGGFLVHLVCILFGLNENFVLQLCKYFLVFKLDYFCNGMHCSLILCN